MDKRGKATKEMEIIPNPWLIAGVNPECYFPPSKGLNRRQLDIMIKEHSKPKDNYQRLRVRVLCTTDTFELALKKLEEAQDKSNLEDNVDGTRRPDNRHNVALDSDDNVSVSAAVLSEDSNKSSAASDKNFRHDKRKKNKGPVRTVPVGPIKSKKIDRVDVPDERIDDLGAFHDFMNSADDPGIFSSQSASEGRRNVLEPSTSSASLQRCNTWKPSSRSVLSSALSPLVTQSNILTQNTSVAGKGTNSMPDCPRSSGSARSLFPTSELGSQDFGSPYSYVTKSEFQAFERIVITKLNSIAFGIQQLQDNNVRKEILECPGLGEVTLPVNDIAVLEKLDEKLVDAELRSKLAKFLAQKGGKKLNLFLSRVLPALLTDEVCHLTNWSGSAFSSGALHLDGTPMDRQYKKTFANLLNVMKLLNDATALNSTINPTPTESEVEDYVKKWLLCYKDRLTPRDHRISEKRVSPRKKSPRKQRK